MVKIFELKNWHKHSISLVLLGSIPGAILRWQINHDFWSNILGSAFLGVVFGLKLKQRVQLILVVGLCGSLTTFSGWMFTSFDLLLKGFFWQSFILIIGSLISGCLALSLGFFMGKKLRQLFMP